ncbi:uncharacterized protein V1510DRAFT_408882 [Dipodascopsis tothii]|uniref:uncharacterized protein n=1 Tax=Dipodascopsis tothii TaxID=44089 RepID=UPI0034CF283B
MSSPMSSLTVTTAPHSPPASPPGSPGASPPLPHDTEDMITMDQSPTPSRFRRKRPSLADIKDIDIPLPDDVLADLEREAETRTETGAGEAEASEVAADAAADAAAATSLPNYMGAESVESRTESKTESRAESSSVTEPVESAPEFAESPLEPAPGSAGPSREPAEPVEPAPAEPTEPLRSPTDEDDIPEALQEAVGWLDVKALLLQAATDASQAAKLEHPSVRSAIGHIAGAGAGTAVGPDAQSKAELQKMLKSLRTLRSELRFTREDIEFLENKIQQKYAPPVEHSAKVDKPVGNLRGKDLFGTTTFARSADSLAVDWDVFRALRRVLRVISTLVCALFFFLTICFLLLFVLRVEDASGGPEVVFTHRQRSFYY